MIDSNYSFERLYNSALKFLSYRPRSEKEIRDRLKLKAHPFGKLRTKVKNTRLQLPSQSDGGQAIQNSKVIDEVIQKLKEKKFINDEEFARSWIESRSNFKPRSIKLIKFELKQKGVSNEIIDRLIHDSNFIIHSDLDQAKRLVEKRLTRYKGLDRQKIYEKLGRYLASKGFNWDTIKKSIDEVLEKGV